MPKINEFEKLLRVHKVELERRLQAITMGVRNESNPVSPDSAEQAVERENDEVIDALGISAREELALVNKALTRIENNEYFECAECGEQIGEARLHSVPYTSYCVDCTEEQEGIEMEKTNAA